MTAAPSPGDGAPMSPSLPNHAATEVKDGGKVEVAWQQAADPELASPAVDSLSAEKKKKKKRPWWKRRRAQVACAAGGLLLVAFVVLLTLGLLGYLRKVGPFANFFFNKTTATRPPVNPLSTIPLMADPFANQPPAAADSATSNLDAAGLHIPTNRPTTNAGQGATVNLGYATYVGTTVPGGVNRFLGMRYAAPPVGNLRWRAPAPPPTSATAQPATDFGPICLGIAVSLPNTAESEDCLFVNVWAPANANTTSKLPVWLFIQGGGYVSNSNANWDGVEVVQTSGNKIVFVNFNYRVALWGFLASAKIQANGALNAGLLDQRFVMRWVKDHIASFGGDPNNVVIHGASAGAGSAALHLAAYGGRDDALFSAAIGESVFFPAQPFVPQLEYQFDRVTSATGCAAPGMDQLDCLRRLDTAVLQAQNIPAPFPGRSAAPVPLFYWTPCVDGAFLQDLPYNLFMQGKFVRVPLLLGNDNDEGTVFAADAASPAELAVFFQNNFPMLTAKDTDAITALYPLQTPALPRHNPWFPSAAHAYGEATFVCPALAILAAYQAAGAGAALWNYRYNVRDAANDAAGLGVPHLWESYAVFGPARLGAQPAPASYLADAAPAVPVAMAYFLSFVQAHDPNPLRAPGSPAWAAWAAPATNGSRIVMEARGARMEAVGADQAARCAFWAGLAPRTQQRRRAAVGAGRRG